MEEKNFTAKGRIFKDRISKRTWIEIETDDGLRLSVGFKGKERTLDRYFLKTEEFTDNYFLAGEWKGTA
jgi:hypothetical protein